MQFQIPQFIEVEDKIFGPFTFKQFVFMGGGAGTSYILYRILPIYLALPLIAGTVGLAAALAFLEYNGRPFIIAIEHGFYFVLHPKLYLWNNERKRIKAAAKTQIAPAKSEVYIPKLSDSRLHELAWSLDIKERIAGGFASEDERAQGGGVIAPITTMRNMAPRR